MSDLIRREDVLRMLDVPRSPAMRHEYRVAIGKLREQVEALPPADSAARRLAKLLEEGIGLHAETCRASSGCTFMKRAGSALTAYWKEVAGE